jgi:tryptophanyl-tRNA synthetase
VNFLGICLAFSFSRLQLAHSFKDKADRLEDVNAGLFTYPMLMAADILLYDAEIVPVGKDQLQHLEMARDVGARFNNQMGEVFVLPQAELQKTPNMFLELMAIKCLNLEEISSIFSFQRSNSKNK